MVLVTSIFASTKRNTFIAGSDFDTYLIDKNNNLSLTAFIHAIIQFVSPTTLR